MNSSLTISTIISQLLAAIVVMTVMGFTKAYTSYKLGDIAIKNKGKVSLNPKKHFEIIGFFIFAFFGYGWTAPVDTSSLYYKDRKKGTILVCIIPLIVALVIAFILQIVLRLPIFAFNITMAMFINIFISMLSMYFVNFAVFNLIPIYPLFGQKLFQMILPSNKAIMLSQYDKIIQMLVIIFLMLGWLQIILNTISIFILNAMNLIIGIFL